MGIIPNNAIKGNSNRSEQHVLNKWSNSKRRVNGTHHAWVQIEDHPFPYPSCEVHHDTPHVHEDAAASSSVNPFHVVAAAAAALEAWERQMLLAGQQTRV